jgi:hypothetical protein
MTNAVRCSLFAILLLAPRGCHDRDRHARAADGQDGSGAATLTAAVWVPNDAAIERLVAARCAREITCNNVGSGRLFGSEDACARESRVGAAGLRTRACPAGIDGVSLERCLDTIRMEACTRPSDELDRLPACRARELCLKTQMPHR